MNRVSQCIDRRCRDLAIAIAICSIASFRCEAVVIRHDIYDNLSSDNTPNDGTDDTPQQIAQGYADHLALSDSQDPYLAVGEINGCTATWIGNDSSGAWLLTAAHCGGNPATDAQTFTSWDGSQTFTRPIGGWSRFDSPNYVADMGGEAVFDIALMRLDGIAVGIDDGLGGIIAQPTLYGGTAEQGELVTWVGYGVRGTGLIGQQEGLAGQGDWGAGRAAGQNIIDTVRNDTDIELIFDFDDPTSAVNAFEAHLSSGDSGGSAWISDNGQQVLAGIVSESGPEFYGNSNSLTRVSSARSFITGNFAGAQFSAVPEPSAFVLVGLVGALFGRRRRSALGTGC